MSTLVPKVETALRHALHRVTEVRVDRALVEDTVRATWVSSGTAVNCGISAALITSSGDPPTEVLVSSDTATDSGNGHYFRDITLPNTAGWYLVEWRATVDGATFKDRDRFRVITGEVS